MPKLIGVWNPTRGLWETETADLLSEHSEPFSATWPTSGMTLGGVAYVLPTPALHTVGSGSSSLPIPRASRGASGTETMYALGAERSDENRPQGEVLLKTPTSQLAVNGGSQHPKKRKAGGHGPTLADEVEHLLPTPLGTDGGRGPTHPRDGKRGGRMSSIGMLLPTRGEPTSPPSAGGSASQGE